MDTRSERARAVLVACAIGDAAGLPTRGMSPDEIESTYGPPPTWWDRDVVHPTKPGVPEGTITEVTREILAAASVLLDDEAGAAIRDRAGTVPMGWRQLVRAIPVGIATSRRPYGRRAEGNASPGRSSRRRPCSPRASLSRWTGLRRGYRRGTTACGRPSTSWNP